MAVSPADLNPDLDVALTVYAADGTTVVARSAPVTQETNATTATGLGASWTSPALPAGTYFAQVDGAGTGDPSKPGGYSDYASLGGYTIRATTGGSLAVTTSGLPPAEAGTAYLASVAAVGGTSPRTFVACGLPAGS